MSSIKLIMARSSNPHASPARALRDWLWFLTAESHVLKSYPHLLYQQAANQPSGVAPAVAALERHPAGLERRAWLQWLNKPKQQPDRLTLSCVGDNGSLRFSRDGSRLFWFSATGTPIQQWDLWTGAELGVDEKERSEGPEPFWLEEAPKSREYGATALPHDDRTGRAESCSQSADGRRVIENGGGELVLRDTESGRIVLRTGEAEGPVSKCLFSPDGTRFAYANRLDIVVRESLEGRVIAWLHGPSDRIVTFAFSLDGRQLAAAYADAYTAFDEGGSSTIVVWETDATEAKPLEIQGHMQTLTDYAFSPVGARLVTGSADDSIILWDAATGEKIKTLASRTKDNAYPVRSCFFAASGRVVVCQDASTAVHAYASENGEWLWRHCGDVWALAPDGMSLILGLLIGDELRIHNVCTGEIEAVIAPLHLSGEIKSLVVSPDQTLLACLSQGLLRLYDWSTGAERLTFGGHSDGIRAFAFSPDGTRLVAILEHSAPIMWDIRAGTKTRTFDDLGTDGTRCQFTDDGLHVAFETRVPDADERWLRIYGVISQKASAAMPLFSGWTCSRQGDQFVTAAPLQCRETFAPSLCHAQLWRVYDGAAILSFDGQADELDSFAFSPDGMRLAACFGKQGVVVWHTGTGKLLWRFQSREALTAPRWNPDGNLLLFGGREGTVCLLRLIGLTPAEPTL